MHIADKPCAYTNQVDNGRYIDYVSDDTPIGIELLCASKGIVRVGIPVLEEVFEGLSKSYTKIPAVIHFSLH